MKILFFENKAWEKAEHPRYVSNVLKTSESEEMLFEISYHYVEEKYYVETYETRIRSDRYKDTYASWKFFDTLDECFNYIEKVYGVKTVIKE